MSDEAALLRAIYAEPDDDTPRLVYADWLDEHGQPDRAEFIRMQIELALSEPWTERSVDLSIRELQLLHKHRDKWTAELPLFAKLRSQPAIIRRGFPYSLSCTALQYLKNAPQLARESAIQDWSWSSVDEAAAMRLAQSKYLSRIRGLWIGGTTTDPCWTVLASPHMTGLREVRLSDHTTEAPEAVSRLVSLFETPALLSVEGLHAWLQAGERVFCAVTRTRFPRLKSLAIEVPDVQGAALATAPWLPQLTELDVGTLTDAKIGSIQALPSLPALKVFRCDVGNVYSGMGRLLTAPALQSVTEFSLLAMQDRAVDALLDAPFLEQVRVLNLVEPSKCGGCSELLCSTGSFSRLIDSGRLSGLVKLRVRDSGESADALVRAILRSQGLPNLRYLADVSSDTSPEMLKALATTPNLPNLRMVTRFPWGDSISVPPR